jgi:hypothetical protein
MTGGILTVHMSPGGSSRLDSLTCAAGRSGRSSPRRPPRVLALALPVLLLTQVLGAAAQPGALLDLHVPDRRTFELALDEVEIDWSGDPQAKSRGPGLAAAMTPRATVMGQDPARTRVALAGVPDSAALTAEAAALRALNPGAAVHLVLYEARAPRTEATRRLLTTEVAVVMEPGRDPTPVTSGLGGKALRPVGSVPDAFVVEGDDPLAAVALADALRGQPGVRTAYPLLKRLRLPR